MPSAAVTEPSAGAAGLRQSQGRSPQCGPAPSSAPPHGPRSRQRQGPGEPRAGRARGRRPPIAARAIPSAIGRSSRRPRNRRGEGRLPWRRGTNEARRLSMFAFRPFAGSGEPTVEGGVRGFGRVGLSPPHALELSAGRRECASPTAQTVPRCRHAARCCGGRRRGRQYPPSLDPRA